MKVVRPVDARAMERHVDAARASEPTFGDIGATLEGRAPDGFRIARDEILLGHGPVVFARAVQGLQQWEAHRLTGVNVFPKGAPVRSGETVVVTLGSPFLALAAPCRIVRVLDDVGQWGFAYGTLPGHPERGEESFVVTMASDESVRFTIGSLSRPGDRIVGFAGPFARGIQVLATKGYLRALHRHVEREGQGRHSPTVR
jgi:uncharacterized protein (UPF0548 family)